MKGYITQLNHQVHDEEVQYALQLGDECASVNAWIGRHIQIRFLGERRCIACGRAVKKLFQNGYCFPCVTTLAETDLCIVKPHQCHFDQGTCRDESFAKTHCMIPHTVYLSLSSQAKVGITRMGREQTRWVDQGAVQAVAIARTPTRMRSGEMEVEIAQSMPDKTDWRKMVKGIHEEVDLLQLAEKVANRVSETFQPYLLEHFVLTQFRYPVLPGEAIKAVSKNIEKEEVSSDLVGVRGQYLLFRDGVLNVKKFAGYHVALEVS